MTFAEWWQGVVADCQEEGLPVEHTDPERIARAAWDAANTSATADLIAERDILKAMADEYQRWINHHAAGHDYDDFLSKELAQQGGQSA